jgi:hypothetical protein
MAGLYACLAEKENNIEGKFTVVQAYIRMHTYLPGLSVIQLL